MTEYIEREAVCYQLAKQATIDGQPRAIKRAAKIVADFPAADVAPIKHAKWIDKSSKKLLFGRVLRDRIVQCDQCRNYLDMDGVNGGRGDANYCPNCGERMDAKS